MTKEIIVAIISGVLCNFICSLIILFFSRIYFGYKHFGGIRKTARLNKDCCNAGIVNIFPDRKTYIQHKDHGKSNEYISQATHSVLYVGYWLATATEIGELKETIKLLTKKQITVTLVFISPADQSSLNICANYIDTKPGEIATRVSTAIINLLEFKESLAPDQRKYLVIKTHTIPLSTTAFVVDHIEAEKCRILLDYKVFNGSRESSYGIEFQNSNRVVTNKLLQSYLAISNQANEINCFDDL